MPQPRLTAGLLCVNNIIRPRERLPEKDYSKGKYFISGIPFYELKSVTIMKCLFLCYWFLYSFPCSLVFRHNSSSPSGDRTDRIASNVRKMECLEQ